MKILDFSFGVFLPKNTAGVDFYKKHLLLPLFFSTFGNLVATR
jgi:hypothetical protein